MNNKNINLNRSDLEIYLKKRFPTLSTNQIKSALDEIFDSIVYAVAKGERVEIRNFGVFSAKNKSSKIRKSQNKGSLLFK